MAKNKSLHGAKKAKNDEFYTMLEDIEKELEYYKEHFKDKVMYCNCDNETSNFVKYFKDNKEKLGYKDFYHSGLPQSFNGPESIELLKKCDIVVTNPPFSLFREYVAQLVEYDKKFLIIGNKNAITYKEIFRLIKDNKVWLGNSSPDGFRQPDHCEIKNLKGLCYWYTNLDHKKRNEKMTLGWKYKGNEEIYPKYDNYDAIDVSKTYTIPADYDGVMGVPISFLPKYNPEQFEIIWTTDRGGDGYLDAIKLPHSRYDAPVVTGKGLYKRIFIKHKDHKKRNEKMDLVCEYKGNEEKYPKYDNYDAIEVSRTKDIPMDYDGVMGVPISFLTKYNPEQFEILGCTQRGCHDAVPDTRKYDSYIEVRPDGTSTGSSGGKTNENANLEGNDGKKNYFVNAEGRCVQSCYGRIFIKHKR